ncbi:calcium-binding protein [Microvirga sp. ACRRW]|uniref:calcium-binding protein n=1 Tax=Microvirga sp. ACRRW TaxID=2918205 RepID=UPI001EF489EA|nr:calcium-binding protein [Microvirga sp. ACRRW]MCG7394558.1 calcium-binding protein [Microvirga sp. ACRRW]
MPVYDPITDTYTYEAGEDGAFKLSDSGHVGAGGNVIGNFFGNRITGNAGYNLLDGRGGNDFLDGASGVDTLNGGSGSDTLIGGLGADILMGGIDADSMVGGEGMDTYYIDNVGDVIVEAENEGWDKVFSAISYTLGDHLENLSLVAGAGHINATGNDYDNILVGNEGNNILDGGRGDDVLWGMPGVDTLKGGEGNDTYHLDEDYLGDIIVEEANQGSDTIIASITFSLQTLVNVENITLLGTDTINATGNAAVNRLQGNEARNILNGLSGADVMEGRRGDDVYIVDNMDDIVIEHDGEGSDEVLSSVSFTLRTHVEKLVLTGNDHIAGTGNHLDNVILGNGGNNTLIGGAGADTLNGGNGNDTYYVDNVADVVLDTSGKDAIFSSINFTLSDAMENLSADGSASLSLTGNASSNEIVGNRGNDTLDGGSGADSMTGSSGNDVYYVDDKSDRVIETSSRDGSDLVYSSVSYTLSNYVEKLTGIGSGAINLSGNRLSNAIAGNAAKNTIKGQAGNDVLNGGLGNDVLYGGKGKDSFVFNTALNKKANVDTIKDFSVRDDTIRLENAIFKSLKKTGKLNKAFFKIGTKAGDKNDFVIYNDKTGALSYDADGSGKKAGMIKFAQLKAGLSLTAGDFIVI